MSSTAMNELADGRIACCYSTKFCGRATFYVSLLVAVAFGILAVTYRSTDRACQRPELPVKQPIRNGAGSAKNSLTIVTAFFNLGTFAKGSTNNMRGPSIYEKWITAYTYIENSVVAYFDDEAMAKHFRKLRQGKPTKIVMVDRKDMWAFTLQRRSQLIFDQPGYPQNHPKSTNAAYVCAMHAKYELLARTVRQNQFQTNHFAWLDVGLFRDLTSSTSGDNNASFVIDVPECHRNDAVAFSQVYQISDKSVTEIMRHGIDWVSGAFLLGDSETMLKFCADYMHRAENLLDQGLANHDQSVILSMYAPRSNWSAAVPLEGFSGPGSNEWFYVAYRQRRRCLDRRARPQARNVNDLQCSYVLYS